MKNATTYVGIDAHKKDLVVAVLIGNEKTPVTWRLANARSFHASWRKSSATSCGADVWPAAPPDFGVPHGDWIGSWPSRARAAGSARDVAAAAWPNARPISSIMSSPTYGWVNDLEPAASAALSACVGPQDVSGRDRCGAADGTPGSFGIVTARILRHLGLPTELREPRPARAATRPRRVPRRIVRDRSGVGRRMVTASSRTGDVWTVRPRSPSINDFRLATAAGLTIINADPGVQSALCKLRWSSRVSRARLGFGPLDSGRFAWLGVAEPALLPGSCDGCSCSVLNRGGGRRFPAQET